MNNILEKINDFLSLLLKYLVIFALAVMAVLGGTKIITAVWEITEQTAALLSTVLNTVLICAILYGFDD